MLFAPVRPVSKIGPRLRERACADEVLLLIRVNVMVMNDNKQ